VAKRKMGMGERDERREGTETMAQQVKSIARPRKLVPMRGEMFRLGKGRKVEGIGEGNGELLGLSC